MPTYLHPGVYVEEIPSGVRPIEGVATAIAAFLGYAVKGPIGEPVFITRWEDYERIFYGLRDTKVDEAIDAMGYSVRAFFRNGGRKAYIVRLARNTDSKPLTTASAILRSPDEDGTPIEIKAAYFDNDNPGRWGNAIRVTVEDQPQRPGSPNPYTVKVLLHDGRGYVDVESYTDVTFDQSDPQYIVSKLSGASEYINLRKNNAAALSQIRSGDLSDLETPSLNGKKFKLTVGEEVVEFTFAENEFDSQKTLENVATTITNKVSESSVSNFTASTPQDSPTRILLNSAGGALQIHRDSEAAKLLRLDGANLFGGEDGATPIGDEYEAALGRLRKDRDVSIICLPGQEWSVDSGNPIIELALGHAERMRNRMVIVDPPRNTQLTSEGDVAGLGLPTKTYGVLYYPWVKVVNRYYDQEQRSNRNKTLLVPPCGFAAGMWSKIDGRRGVWKAPAGVETALLGTVGAEFDVGDDEQDALNPLGVNVIRRLQVPGLSARVIWGSRTLATKADPEWRYVPVRRTAIFIEQSIYNAIHWAVFEPNDHRLWSSLRINIEAFMNGLFRAGAFQGQKASDAYFVRCGLGDTMTQADIDRGQVIVIVGFAPLKPAEFVIIRIQQKVQEQ